MRINDQLNFDVAGKTCGDCVFASEQGCIITRWHRRKVTDKSVACSEYVGDLPQEPLVTMTLRELGFKPDPKAGQHLQLLGFRNTTIELGDGENDRNIRSN